MEGLDAHVALPLPTKFLLRRRHFLKLTARRIVSIALLYLPVHIPNWQEKPPVRSPLSSERHTATIANMSSMHLNQLRKWVYASPPVEWSVNQVRELLIGSVRQGPVPQHVAFVMDGNRRFARNHKIETVEGHNLGFEALAKVQKPLPRYRSVC